MGTIWKWVGSAAYWRLAAILTNTYLTIAALGKTGDWWFAATIALGFYLCWIYATNAQVIKGKT